MKKICTLLLFMLLFQLCRGQNKGKEYFSIIDSADSLYQQKEFRLSALKYSDAFIFMNGKGNPIHRYNAACSWALSGIPDSAFLQLEKVATASDLLDDMRFVNDKDINSLHKDPRWKILVNKISKRQSGTQVNQGLMMILDSVYDADQTSRQKTSMIKDQYESGSIQLEEHLKRISAIDSLNLIKVKQVLEEYGWSGAEIVGEKGNKTLFLVIQHADLKTQETYLPMMREAVKSGNAKNSDLALLEDRVALGQGRKQIYGSQIGSDIKSKAAYVLPLEDPDNVDARRAAMGLEPLGEYLKFWGLSWDPVQYKTELSRLENLKRQTQIAPQR